MLHADRDGNGIERVANFDLIAPNVAELAGGSMRERDLTKLERRIGALPSGVREKLDW